MVGFRLFFQAYFEEKLKQNTKLLKKKKKYGKH